MSRLMTKPKKNGMCAQRRLRSAWASASLIRVFAVRLKKAWVLSYPLSALRRLIRLGGCPGWSESSLGVHVILLGLSWGGSLDKRMLAWPDFDLPCPSDQQQLTKLQRLFWAGKVDRIIPTVFIFFTYSMQKVHATRITMHQKQKIFNFAEKQCAELAVPFSADWTIWANSQGLANSTHKRHLPSYISRERNFCIPFNRQKYINILRRHWRTMLTISLAVLTNSVYNWNILRQQYRRKRLKLRKML